MGLRHSAQEQDAHKNEFPSGYEQISDVNGCFGYSSHSIHSTGHVSMAS